VRKNHIRPGGFIFIGSFAGYIFPSKSGTDSTFCVFSLTSLVTSFQSALSILKNTSEYTGVFNISLMQPEVRFFGTNGFMGLIAICSVFISVKRSGKCMCVLLDRMSVRVMTFSTLECGCCRHRRRGCDKFLISSEFCRPSQ